jgi:hypothetical protein
VSPRAAAWLFALALAVYAATRFAALADFPIYFFCDEAVQANIAEQLFHDHFRDRDGVLLPPYFLNDQRWAMSLNIYALVTPLAAFGKSILVTRGTFAAVALFGAAALGLALRTAGVGLWWSAPLLLSVLPVDFLHSRMALETTPAFSAAFLCAYLLYRLRSPRWIFLALFFGAATFYSYTAGQGIMLVMGCCLLAVDARYHLRQSPRLLAASALFLALLALPFWREHRRHPGTTREQLLVLHSYWVAPTPLSEKLAIFGRMYVSGFQPRYWFRHNEAELIRHQMDGMAYVPLAFAPAIAVGILACLARWRRSPGHRVILLSPLAVPFAAAMHERQILRVLPMVVPIVLLAAVGLAEALTLLRRRIPSRALAAGLAATLTVAAARLLEVSLEKGPTWFHDYGLYGMQYGARQIFDGIRESLRRSPDTQILLTSSWANTPDVFLDFFLTKEERPRAEMGGIETYLLYRTPVEDRFLFVLTEEEYEKARRSPKLLVRPPERTISYPDLRPGFRFVRLAYSPEADAIFAAELEQRRVPREHTVQLDGQRIVVRHSLEDMGQVSDLFDKRFDSTFRGLEANPFVLEFLFEKPRPMAGIDLLLARMDCDIRIEIAPAGGEAPLLLTRQVRGLETDHKEEFRFPSGPVEAKRVRIEILLPFGPEHAHVELREVEFR